MLTLSSNTHTHREVAKPGRCHLEKRKLPLVLLMEKCPDKQCWAVVSASGQDPPGEPGASSRPHHRASGAGGEGIQLQRRAGALPNADLLPDSVLDCRSPREYRRLPNARLGSAWRRGQETTGSSASAADPSTPLVCSAVPVMLHLTGETGGPNKEQL